MQLIAMLSMLIDHVGLVFFPGSELWRIVGRLAMPLYAWGIVQGYLHTRSRKAYLLRLLALAGLSELPFCLAFNRLELNIIATFVVCLLVLLALDWLAKRKADLRIFASAFIVILAALLLLELLPFDYGAYGLLLILIYRYGKGWPVIIYHQLLNVAWLFYLGWADQSFSILSTVAIVTLSHVDFMRYRLPRFVWRSWYPVHLSVIAVVAYAVGTL